jgi:hypothetical protein
MMYEELFKMMFNYEERAVAHYESGVLAVDTCSVSDGEKEFETAVMHPSYLSNWIIVEAYDTKEDAEKGHEKWVNIMMAEELPDKLVDCGNCPMGFEIFGTLEYPYMPL